MYVCLGIKHEWQVNGLDDIQDRMTLAEKLGGNTVISLEGKPLWCHRQAERSQTDRRAIRTEAPDLASDSTLTPTNTTHQRLSVRLFLGRLCFLFLFF